MSPSRPSSPRGRPSAPRNELARGSTGKKRTKLESCVVDGAQGRRLWLTPQLGQARGELGDRGGPGQVEFRLTTGRSCALKGSEVCS
jgi:hypothetical protein